MSLSPRASTALRRAYTDLFALAVQLLEGRASSAQSGAHRVTAETRIARAREQLLAAGIKESWIDAVQFPVVGLLDEAARGSPARGYREAWKSLQFPLYGHEEVGRKVFERLKALRVDPDTPVEVLEVYARCLDLGFTGEYAPHRLDDLGTLREGLRIDLAKRLGTPTNMAPDLPELPAGASVPRILGPRWIVGFTAAIVAVLWLGLTLLLVLDARVAERRIDALTPSDAPPSFVNPVGGR